MNVENKEQLLKEALEKILTNEQLTELEECAHLYDSILIKGPQGPTGKTTTVEILRALGYTVYEESAMLEIHLGLHLWRLLSSLL